MSIARKKTACVDYTNDLYCDQLDGKGGGASIKSWSRFLPSAVWLVPCVLAVIMPVAGYFSAQWRSTAVDRAMRADLLDHAVALARTVNLERVAALTFTTTDNALPAFQRLREQFAAWQTVADCRGIYTIARRDGRLVFGPESYAAADPQASPPGTIYEKPSPGMVCFFDDGVPFTEGPYTDEYGTFVSALAPVLSAVTGKPLMAVGLDIEALDWNRILDRQRWNLVLASLVLAVILLAGGLLLYRREHTSGSRGLARHLETILTAVMGLVLTVVAAWALDDAEVRARRQAFAHVAESRAADIAWRFTDLRENVLGALVRFYSASDQVNRLEFHDFVKPHLNQAGVRALAWIPVVPASGKAAFEDRMHAEGSAEYTVWRHDAAGVRVPAMVSENYYPIMYVEPMAGNTGALGFDVMAVPERRVAIERAVQSRFPTATEVITMAHEPIPVVAVFQPVFASAAPEKLDGLVALVILPDEFLRMISWRVPNVSAATLMDLYALEVGRPPHFLAASAGSGVFPCPYIAGPRFVCQHHHALCRIYPVLAFGKTYVLTVHPAPAFLAEFPQRTGLIALWTGLLITSMVVLLVATNQQLKAVADGAR